MIRIQLEHLMVVYLLAMLAFIGLLWLVGERRRRARDIRLRRRLTQCSTCHAVFRMDAPGGDPQPCPRCGSLNEPRPFEPL